MGQSKASLIISWVLQILLALFYVIASLGKVTGNPAIIQMFRDWGFPDGFHLVIGVLEILGAIGLLVPRTAPYAALGLVGLMVGAGGTHLVHGEGLQVLRPLIPALLLAVVAWMRWPRRSGGTA